MKREWLDLDKFIARSFERNWDDVADFMSDRNGTFDTDYGIRVDDTRTGCYGTCGHHPDWTACINESKHVRKLIDFPENRILKEYKQQIRDRQLKQSKRHDWMVQQARETVKTGLVPFKLLEHEELQPFFKLVTRERLAIKQGTTR